MKCLSSIAMKKVLVRIVEHQPEGAFLDGRQRDVQLGHFFTFSHQNSQQPQRLNSLYFFNFLKWLLEKLHSAQQRWRAIKQLNHPDSWSFSFAIKGIQNYLQAISTLVFYPVVFVASTACPDSATLSAKETYLTNFKLGVVRRWGLISICGSGLLWRVKSILLE